MRQEEGGWEEEEEEEERPGSAGEGNTYLSPLREPADGPGGGGDPTWSSQKVLKLFKAYGT